MSLGPAPDQKQAELSISSIGFLFFITSAVLITLFLPISTHSPNDLEGWSHANLLWVDSGDQAPPQNSLVAVYQRQLPHEFQIRLDILEIPTFNANDLQIALDTIPGGNRFLPSGEPTAVGWDFLILIPADQTPVVMRSNGTLNSFLIPRVIEDPFLDAIIIAWNSDILSTAPANFKFQVFLSPPGENIIASRSPALHSNLKPPPAAPLLLAFWNTLPSSTPAQALRRWDGAHTGPLGQRHGLNILINRASQANIPIALLDLSRPDSIRTLDYMGQAEKITDDIRTGQIILPLVTWGDPNFWKESLALASQSLTQQNLPQSSYFFGAIPQTSIKSGNLYFADLADRRHIVSWKNARFIPLPISLYRSPTGSFTRDEISETGLSLTLKQELLSVAISSDPSDLVVLGGNLTQSLWGEDSISPHALKYITAHPWITTLDAHTLQTLPVLEKTDWPLPGCDNLLCTSEPPVFPLNNSQGDPNPSKLNSQQLQNIFRDQLLNLPDNAYSRSALKSYLMLTSGSSNPDQQRLQANYLSQVGYLIYASHWADHPSTQLTSNLDLDWDGFPEVILSSEHVLIILERDGGRIVFAGSPTDQWLALASQFAVGIGSPDEWRLNLGTASDPADFPGALTNLLNPFQPNQVNTHDFTVTLTDPVSSTVKSIQLTASGFSVSLSSPSTIQTQIPMALASSTIPPINWAVLSQPLCSSDRCIIPTSKNPWIISTQPAHISLTSSLDSASLLQSAEIPDRSYSPGHFMPFPLAVLNIQGYQTIKLEFSDQ